MKYIIILKKENVQAKNNFFQLLEFLFSNTEKDKN